MSSARDGSVVSAAPPPSAVPFRGGTPSVGLGFPPPRLTLGGFGALSNGSRRVKSSEEERVETRLAESKRLHKAAESERAAAGFKWVRDKASGLWRSGSEPADACRRLRDMQVDAQVCLGWALLGCKKRDKSHQAFRDALDVSKEFGDRINEANSNIGLAATYHAKDRDDPKKLHFAERAMALATEVFQDANLAFVEGAHPLQLPPFHGGTDAGGDMSNTLRNKILVGETATPRDLEVNLAKAQALMANANAALGKAKYGR